MVSAPRIRRVLVAAAVGLSLLGLVLYAGPAGGRPAAQFRFAAHGMEVTDPFAVLKPPSDRILPERR